MNSSAIVPLTMPKWGMAMAEGTVTAWLKDTGEQVEVGDELFEIETEKIVNAYEATCAGTLRRQVAPTGVTLPVGSLLGVIAPPEIKDTAIDEYIAEFQVPEAADDTMAQDTAQSEAVEVEGKPTRYLLLGESGPPVVLIHGFGGDLNSWLFNQPVLAQTHRTLSLDLPGHGGSAKTIVTGDLDELATAVLGLLQVLELAPAHVVGHSLGGAVAVRAFENQPDRFLSLTLINSVGPGTEVDRGYIEGFVAAKRRKEMREVVLRLFANKSLVTRQLVDDVLKTKRIDGADACLRQIAEASLFTGTAHALERVAVPLQIIWGAEDEIAAAQQCSGLPDDVALNLFDGIGHMAHMEAASTVNGLLLAHFARAVNSS